MFYIQLIGLLGFFVAVLSFYKKETVTILTYQITSNFAYAVHYFLLGGLSGTLCSLIGIIRNLVLIKSDNKKIIIPTFVLLYILITIVFYEGLYSLFPMIANSIYLIMLTTKNKKKILMAALISSVLWILYSIFVSSYVTVATEIIMILSNTIQLIKIKNKK